MRLPSPLPNDKPSGLEMAAVPHKWVPCGPACLGDLRKVLRVVNIRDARLPHMLEVVTPVSEPGMSLLPHVAICCLVLLQMPVLGRFMVLRGAGRVMLWLDPVHNFSWHSPFPSVLGPGPLDNSSDDLAAAA